MCTCLATNKAFMPAKAWKVYYERKFKREESNINRTHGVITYVVHPSRALSGRKEKFKNKNSVLRFFPPTISVHWSFCLCNWGVESSQSFYFFPYQKRITSFRPPNPHKQKSQCTRIVEKKISITKSFALITMGPTLVVRVSLQLGKSPSAPPWVLHAHKS